jgi:uncharacterized protein
VRLVQLLAWSGLDAPRMELARVSVDGRDLTGSGTQLGVVYELRYELEPGRLRLEVVGGSQVELGLDGYDFFDLAYSPLFNSLPVLKDGLLAGSGARDYVMRFVTVPELVVSESQQRYEPLGGGLVRFSSGDFVADLQFDDDGFVVRYEGLAERVG